MPPLAARRWSAVFSAIIATALIGTMTPAVVAGTGPIGVWHVEGNFGNAKGTSPKLRKLGTPVFKKVHIKGNKKKALVFDEGEGLKIRDIPKTARRTYTIDILLEFDGVDGFRRIMSFGPNDTDRGLYFEDGLLNLFDSKVTPAVVAIANDWVHVRVTRKGRNGKMKIYLDGTQRLKFNDTEGTYVLRKGRTVLFRDNPSSGEHSSGTVSTIKLWRRVVAP